MPPFPRKLLADHEKIVFDLKPHWVALVTPVLWALALAVVWIVAFRLIKDNLDPDGDPRRYLRMLVSIGVLAGMFYFTGFPIMKWATTHFVLTTDRLITRHGVIAKSSREIPLERINDVAFNQSILERFLGAGDLLIESAGERGQSRITNVRNPENVQLMIYKETEENNNRMARPQAATPSPEATPPPEAKAHAITDQIAALARLKDQGAISETEYESKKQELLDRM